MVKIFYRNRLPHITPLGAEFFITFRLADSLPISIINSLKEDLDLSIQKLKREKPKNYTYQIHQLKHNFFNKYDHELDKNPYGSCYLINEKVAQIVADRLHKFDDEYYELEAYTIMPNHVHLLINTAKQLNEVEIDSSSDEPKNYVQLHKIMQLIKGGAAIEANRILGRSGKFWMKDSYDHYVRNATD